MEGFPHEFADIQTRPNEELFGKLISFYHHIYKIKRHLINNHNF